MSTETEFDMVTLESSNLEAAGYDRERERMCIRFKRFGATYFYDRVPGEVYAGLLLADSPGRYFAATIRDRFPTSRKPER